MKKKTLNTINDIKKLISELLLLDLESETLSLVDNIKNWIATINMDNDYPKHKLEYELKDNTNDRSLLITFLLKKISLYLLYLVNNKDKEICYEDLFILKEKVDRYLAIN